MQRAGWFIIKYFNKRYPRTCWDFSKDAKCIYKEKCAYKHIAYMWKWSSQSDKGNYSVNFEAAARYIIKTVEIKCLKDFVKNNKKPKNNSKTLVIVYDT